MSPSGFVCGVCGAFDECQPRNSVPLPRSRHLGDASEHTNPRGQRAAGWQLCKTGLSSSSRGARRGRTSASSTTSRAATRRRRASGRRRRRSGRRRRPPRPGPPPLRPPSSRHSPPRPHRATAPTTTAPTRRTTSAWPAATCPCRSRKNAPLEEVAHIPPPIRKILSLSRAVAQ